MVDLFSSSEATAIANGVVFAGILLAVARVARRYISSFASIFFRVARRAQQSLLLRDLRRIREYKNDKSRAIYDFVDAFFSDIIMSFLIISGTSLFWIWYVRIDLDSELNGDQSEIWSQVVRDPMYWWDIFAILITLPIVMGAILLFGMRVNLRLIKLASHPEEMRREILNRYLSLRSRR